MSLEIYSEDGTDTTAKDMFEIILDRLENRATRLTDMSASFKVANNDCMILKATTQDLRNECDTKREMLEILDSKILRIHKLLKNDNNHPEECIKDALCVIAEPFKGL